MRVYNKINILLFLLLVSSQFLSAQQNELTTVFLVRHCEKEVDGTKDPNLLKSGFERAEELARVLENSELDAVFATQYKRTQQTAKPTADKFGLELQIIESLKGEDLKYFMENILKKFKGKRILIASHSNIVPVLIKIIRKEDFSITKMEYINDSIYDDLFVVSFTNRENVEVINLKYGRVSSQ